MRPHRSLLSRVFGALLLGLGLAAAAGAEEPSSAPERLDVVFAIDASTNAVSASGADVDGDGRAGTQRYFLGFLPRRPDPADCVLAAELKAVRSALDRLDARTTRVGAVAYAGDPADPGKRGAELLAPLTDDYERVRTALAALAARGPKGLTDLASGIDLATTQLRGTAGDPSAPSARRVIVLLSDGRPTMPHIGDPVTNRSESVAAALRAARADTRILVHGIGTELFEPLLQQIAGVSKGEYARVEDPARIDLVGTALFGPASEAAAP